MSTQLARREFANSAEQLRRRLELRRSGAAGKHLDRRERRARTRQAQHARALREAL